MQPAPPPNLLRVDGAFGRALETMKSFLFRPFDLGKWFAFGVIVWLAQLGEGTASFPRSFDLPGRSGSGTSGSMPDFRVLQTWFHDNQATLIVAGIALGVLVLALSALVSWLSARGTMMGLRAIALNHVRLGEHWAQTREAAWAYFGFRLLLAAIGLPVVAAALAWAAVALLRVMASSSGDVWDYVWAVAPPVALMLAFSVLISPVQFVGRNLLAPFLLRFGGGLRANWSRTMDVVRANLGGVLVFMLVRMLIALVQGIAETLAVYITCCIGGLPVLHQVAVAPFTAFERAYTLRVLESLGPEYKLIVEPPPWIPYVGPPG